MYVCRSQKQPLAFLKNFQKSENLAQHACASYTAPAVQSYHAQAGLLKMS